MSSKCNQSYRNGQMKMSSARIRNHRFGIALAVLLPAMSAVADGSYHDLATGAFSQNWSNAAMITANDNWSGVPSILGYRGDNLVATTGCDPQTILADGTNTPTDVNANQSAPNTYATGGITEFDGIADRTVALMGSGTARAPFLLLHLCSTGMKQVRVRYDLRDIDGSADNAVQPVALHYRVGSAGPFVNVPAAFVADASTGPSLATNVTSIDVILPAAADDQAQLQVRIMTADAAGNDEWIGVDNILVRASPVTAIVPAMGGEVDRCTVACSTRKGWMYQLQRSTNLTDWVDVGGAFAGDGTVHPFDDAMPGACGFWRVEVK